MQRRQFLQGCSAWLSTALLRRGGVWHQGASLAKRPNVLFIAIDDLNDWVGCLGGSANGVTPNIDRLARRGRLFTNAHCPSPACNPSRTAVLTGLHPTTTGWYANTGELFRVLPGLANWVTLPQYFQAHGYRVLGRGKIFHTADFASWDEFIPPWAPMRPGGAPLNGLENLFDWGPLDIDDAGMGDTHVADWAIEQLATPRVEPLFLGVGFVRPHTPMYAPRPYFDHYPVDELVVPPINFHDLDDVPEAGEAFAEVDVFRRIYGGGKWSEAVVAYLACMRFVDKQIGRVIDALDAGPYADNTIIVLWSDHGWHLGEKRHWQKKTLWEEATRVPLIIVPPRGVTGDGSPWHHTYLPLVTAQRGGVGFSEPALLEPAVSTLDIYPTLIEMCGLPVKAGLGGVSLVPLLGNRVQAWTRPALTTWLFGNHAVRSARWRYIRYADGGEELYDHVTDPREWVNLATEGAYREVKETLAAWLPQLEAQPYGSRGGRSLV